MLYGLSLTFIFADIIMLVYILGERIIGTKGKIRNIIFIFLVIMTIIIPEVIYNLEQDGKEWVQLWSTDIVALKDDSEIYGKGYRNLFVGSISIREESYYYCMEVKSDGKHLIKIPVENAYINENNNDKPTIKKFKEEWATDRATKWLGGIENYKYIITVPENTIDATYKIDME